MDEHTGNRLAVMDEGIGFEETGAPLAFDNIVWPDNTEEQGRLIARKDDFSNLDDAISKHIQQALEMTRGKIHGSAGAAQLLGINPSTLRHRMRKLRIPHGRQKQRRIY